MKQIMTPDGQYYGHMGAGFHVPRPYSLRTLARLIPPTGKAWNVVMFVSLAVIAVCVAIMATAKGLNPVLCLACIGLLPWMRNAVSMPVLLDLPQLATACLIAAIAPHVGVWIGLFVVASVVVKEKTPLWSALYALMFTAEYLSLGLGVALAGAITAVQYATAKPHPDESKTEWLKNPIKTAIAHHLPTVHNYKVWLSPWGGLVVGLATYDWHVWLVMAMAYGQCLFAMDRTRVIAMACVPLVFSAVTIAGDYAVLLPLTLWFSDNVQP